MIEKLWQAIFWTEPFDYIFDVPLELAVSRLQSEVSDSWYLFGIVERDEVDLTRLVPLFSNLFKPHLIGSFQQLDERTRLVGSFRFHRLIQVFMATWFFGLILFTVMAAVGYLLRQTGEWYLPLFSVAMAIVGYAIMDTGKRLSGGDIHWLENRVKNAVLGVPR